MNIKNISIFNKIVLYFFLISFSVTSVVVMVTIYRDSEKFKQDIHSDFERIKNHSLEAISSAVYEEDDEHVLYLLKEILGNPNFKHVQITEENKRSYQLGKRPNGPSISSSFNLSLPKNNYSIIENFGKIKIVAGLDRIKNKRIESLITHGLIQFLQVFFVTIIMFHLFQKMLINHLKEFASYAQNFNLQEKKQKDFKLNRKKRPANQEDELDLMVKSFNIMKNNLFESHEQIQDYTLNLEKKVVERTLDLNMSFKETRQILDSMRQSVFTIDQNFQIHPPISKHSEKIFGKNIESKNLFDTLYTTLKKGSKSYQEIRFCLDSIFGYDKINFLVNEDYLPKKIEIPDPNSSKEKILKINYEPLLVDQNKVEKLMIVVEDITEFESYFKEAKKDQLSFLFTQEIVQISSKNILLENLEESLQMGLNTLEDFTSAVSETYSQQYFKKKLKEIFKKMLFNLKFSDNLYLLIETQLQDINQWDEISSSFNFQLSSVEKLGIILENVFMYSRVLELFIPFNLSIKLSFKDSIKDKIDDIRKIFTNLFVYIPGLENLDKKKLVHVAKIVKMYPEFDRTMDLIHQRCKLVSFLLKASMENELSELFFELSINIQKITNLNKGDISVLKNNLILPYNKLIQHTKKIESSFKKGETP